MQTVDYSTLFDSRSPHLMGLSSAEVLRWDTDAIRLRSRHAEPQARYEAVRFSEQAILLATECTPGQGGSHRQIVSGEDWVHIQFRFRGGGHEHISNQHLTQTPERSCIVSRYPQDAIVEREIRKTAFWKYVCLYLTPRGLTELLQISFRHLPESVSWLATGERRGYQTHALPLNAAVTLAVDGILGCTFTGVNRHAFMRAKALELLTNVIHLIDAHPSEGAQPALVLSVMDRDKIRCAQSLMMENLDRPVTLAALARKVGLNRTKLALGFKQVYGVSLQAYWRDARLVRAREWLQADRASITDVAFRAGYAELSSFTRAFTRKFGMSPRDCRKGA